jgi:hypothetical protein
MSMLCVNGCLRIIALHEAVRTWHDARFLVGQVNLRRRLDAKLGRLGRKSRRLLSRSFLECFARCKSLRVLRTNLDVPCGLSFLNL